VFRQCGWLPPGDAAVSLPSGGIALKVEEAVAVARLGIPVLIAEAGSQDGAAALELGLGVGCEERSAAGVRAAQREAARDRTRVLLSAAAQVVGRVGGSAPSPQQAWRGTLVELVDGDW
jgi:isopentenyl phosphate kinase